MFTSIFHAGTFAIAGVLTAMCAAILLGIAVALIYRLRCSWPTDFCVMLAVMPLLVTSMIMIVNGNLGASVAVLGAFGLVRFRSAPGTAKEIGFLFFAMAVGLACGMGFISLAVLITAAVSAVMLGLEAIGFSQGNSRFRQLKITIPEDMNYVSTFDDVFKRYTKKAVLETVRTTNLGTMYELVYKIELRKAEQEKTMIDEIRCRNGNLNISSGMVPRFRNEF